ncbi:MAG: vWA domain-containing protein [Candidatus Angelobacter sp.]
MRRMLLLVILASPMAAVAQDCPQTMPTIMLDEQTGTFVPSMTASRLHAKIGSSLVPVTSVERISGFRLLILIDASASMEETSQPFTRLHTAVALVNDTLDELLGELPAGVEVEYGLFNTFAVFGPNFTADREELRQSKADLVQRLKHKGLKTTALYAAIREGLTRFDSPHPGDSILMVTDGQDNESAVGPGKIQGEAAQKGIRLFSIVMRNNEMDYDGSRINLLNFAERTGASLHVISTSRNSQLGKKEPEEEKQDLQRFLKNEVLSGYLLRFNPPAGKRKGKWMLSVDRLPGQTFRVVSSFPSHLNPCPVTTAAAR